MCMRVVACGCMCVRPRRCATTTLILAAAAQLAGRCRRMLRKLRCASKSACKPQPKPPSPHSVQPRNIVHGKKVPVDQIGLVPVGTGVARQ